MDTTDKVLKYGSLAGISLQLILSACILLPEKELPKTITEPIENSRQCLSTSFNDVIATTKKLNI